MKKIFKKNQIIVTMLAVLIAIAGYLNYTDKLTKDAVDSKEADKKYEDTYEGDDLLTSDDDILSLDVDSMQVEDESVAAASEDVKKDDAKTEEADNNENESSQPGDAVLTSGDSMGSFTIEARLNREQTRSKNKETLLEVINNENINKEQKQSAVDAMVNITEITELENTIETLLEAKGFNDVVVNLTDKSADVIIDAAQVTDSDRAQIEDVITRKTDIKIDKIVITPLNIN